MLVEMTSAAEFRGVSIRIVRILVVLIDGVPTACALYMREELWFQYGCQ